MDEYENSYRLTSIENTLLRGDCFQRPVGSDVCPELIESLEWNLFFVIEPRKFLDEIGIEIREEYGSDGVDAVLIGMPYPERLCILCKQDVSWVAVYSYIIKVVDRFTSDPFESFESAEVLFKKDRTYFDRILLGSFGILNVIED